MTDYAPRPQSETESERRYLQERLREIERDMARVAAPLGSGAPIAQPLDVLDRARELTGHLLREVQVRPLAAALGARLFWLDRAEARAATGNGEPRIALTKIDLDRRLLRDLAAGWRARTA